jgi:hypothetical protein
MPRNQPARDEGTGRVLRFPGRLGAERRGVRFAGDLTASGESPVEGMGKYERAGTEPDDYRHRMLVNGLVLGASVVLIATGIWLATKIADLRRDLDCVLAGRRNCAQLSITGNATRYP